MLRAASMSLAALAILSSASFAQDIQVQQPACVTPQQLIDSPPVLPVVARLEGEKLDILRHRMVPPIPNSVTFMIVLPAPEDAPPGVRYMLYGFVNGCMSGAGLSGEKAMEGLTGDAPIKAPTEPTPQHARPRDKNDI